MGSLVQIQGKGGIDIEESVDVGKMGIVFEESKEIDVLFITYDVTGKEQSAASQ